MFHGECGLLPSRLPVIATSIGSQISGWILLQCAMSFASMTEVFVVVAALMGYRECRPLPFRLPATWLCHGAFCLFLDFHMISNKVAFWMQVGYLLLHLAGRLLSPAAVPLLGETQLVPICCQRESRPLPFRLPGSAFGFSHAVRLGAITIGNQASAECPVGLVVLRTPSSLLKMLQNACFSHLLKDLVGPISQTPNLQLLQSWVLRHPFSDADVRIATPRESGPLPFRLPSFCSRKAQQPRGTTDVKPRCANTVKPGIRPLGRMQLLILAMCLTLRIGEARNPGPDTEVVVGTCNASGLLHKSSLMADLPPGIWGASETHLTHQGVQKFRTDLKHRGCPARFVPGAPAPKLTDSPLCIGGKCTGVGFLSHHPIRAMPSDFTPELWATGRLQVAAAHVNGVWLRMGLVYGYSANNKNIETMQKTDALLAEITERIVMTAHGPRIIMGDFNTHTMLPQMDLWKSKGFVEIQQIARERWNRAVMPTYRDTTVIDQVWISPELVPFLHQVRTDTSYFNDHACLYATFKGLPVPAPCRVWRQPLPLPWDDLTTSLPDATDDTLDPTCPEFLPRFFKSFETEVDKHCTAQLGHGLLQSQKGRCATTTAKFKQHPVAPNRRARPGEVEVTYLGETFHHVQWCRQLRRLQSFAKAVQREPAQQHKREHITQLWKAILRAPGFHRGFSHFWRCKAFALPEAPKCLPTEPPGSKSAEVIFLTFKHEFDLLEKALIRARGQAAKQRRKADANVAFADVARRRALPVQTLARSAVARIIAIDQTAKTATYAPAAFACDQPVYGPAGLLTVESHTPGSLVLSHGLHEVDVDDELTQLRLDGSAEEVAEAFVALWKPMWNKHQDLPPNHWDRAVAQLAECMPVVQGELQMPPIQPAEWIQAVKRKKPRSATGPDGIARKDLLAMKPSMVAKLVDHINMIDQGILPWHPSTLTGLIALVEKRPDASTPQDFRPICVLSFLYRTWTSIRAKQCLAWLDKIASPGQHGNRPGTSARHVWWRIAQQLELYQLDGVECSGIVTDVVKCFNTLPRPLVAFCGRYLGLPKAFLHSWHQAVAQLDRRFVICGHVSGGTRATTGYPEGCALSVVAMSIMNVAMHGFVSKSLLSTRVISYVDNWEGFTTEPDEVLQLAAMFRQFAELVDVQLDSRKTETWSLTATGRKQLRQHGFTVALAARDLGGQLVYCKRPCIATIKSRIAQHSIFWHWLGRSLASTATKMRMLHTVAWPRLLHGISNQSLGGHHFQQMRIAAMQALQWQKKGASSLVQFALDRDPRADPEFYSLMVAVRDFRDLHDPSVAFPVLNRLSVMTATTAAQGPCKALLDRFHLLSWKWLGNGFLSDHEHLQWHIVDAPIQWVVMRLRQGWAKHIGGLMSSRHTFGGMQCVDIYLSHEGCHHYSAPAQGFLRVLRNGTFYTRDMVFQTGKVPDTKCPFCSEPDSIRHRHWECSHFASIRAKIDPMVIYWLQQEPTCFQFRGWVIEDVCQQLFRKSLFDIPDTLDQHDWPNAAISNPVHFFTDGSCLHPETPGLRLGTWAVCVAQLPDDCFHTIATGGIPHGLHTTLRAEICAAIAAFHAGIARRCQFTVWTDNETVYRRLRVFLTQGCFVSSPKQTNHDLWNQLSHLCREADQLGLQPHVIKVRSHQDMSCYPDRVEKWAIAGNAAADSAAGSAFDSLPLHVRNFWEAACARTDRVRRMRDGLRQLITEAGFLATANKTEVEANDEAAWQTQLDQPRPYDVAELSLSPMTAECKLPAKHTLGTHANRIFEWLITLQHGDNVKPMWLSSHHLLIHFQGTSGLLGYKFNQKTNRWDAVTDDSDPEVPFPKLANAFQAAVKCLAKGLGLPFLPTQRLPAGNAYRCWINCLLIMVSEPVFCRIDRLMAERGAAGISNVNKAMKRWTDFRGSLAL